MKNLVALFLLISLPVWAAPTHWVAKPGAGKITFTAYWNGSPIKGQFPEFQLTAKLDSEHPKDGVIKLVIDTPKLRTQSADITQAIRGEAWFNVKKFPHASFKSTAISPQAGNDALQLTGRLHIKGHEKTVSFPISIQINGDTLKLSGKVRLNRTDYAIGAGEWSSPSIIAHEVDINFAFELQRAE